MKRLLLMLALMGSGVALMAQSAVNYGFSSGTSGSGNSFFGYYTGNTVTDGQNTAMGAWSMRFATTGVHNVAIGNSSMYSNKGSYNVAVGSSALNYNKTTNFNVAVGYAALQFAESSGNTAVGYQSMYGGAGVFTGYENCAFGAQTLYKNKTGNRNVALGYTALFNNSNGYFNAATGFEAMYSNTTGSSNTASGYGALRANTTGGTNAALGAKSLWNNTGGNSNAVVGYEVMNDNTTGSNNSAVGYRSLRYNTTGNYNSALGYQASTSSGATYSYSTALGCFATTTATDQVRVGDPYVNSIGGVVDWTVVSDGRFKSDVKENIKGLAFINELRPVSYELDRNAIAKYLNLPKEAMNRTSTSHYQTGFIAQEVEATAKKVGFEHFSGVDAPKNDKDHYGLRYAEFVVPLVKSVQELSAQNEAQATTIETQQAALETQQASIEELKGMIAQQQAQIEQLLQARTTHTTTTNAIEGARLGQNTPNPFNAETSIQVEVPATAKQAFLQVSNLEGKQLLVQEIGERGASTVIFQAGQLPAGIYLYTLVVDDQLVDSKRMVLTQ